MSIIMKICGAALVAAVTGFSIKGMYKGMSVLTVTAGMFIIILLLLENLGGGLEALNTMVKESGTEEYYTLMIKVLGIGITVKTASDICRDLGSESLAGGIELAGKIEIVLLCLPHILEMTYTLKELAV